MISFLNTLSFTTPLALWGLAALPVIWWLLRFTPPRPQSIKFPPLRILLKLQPKEDTPHKTPWWLLLLRLAMAALLILAVAHPLSRKGVATTQNTGPLLVIVDDGWAAAKNWPQRQEALRSILEDARDANRVVTLATTSVVSELTSIAASDALNLARALQPQALNTNRLGLLVKLKSQNVKAGSVTWLTDGTDAGSAAAFHTGLISQFGQNIKALTFNDNELPIVLARPVIDGSDIKVTALRNAQAKSTTTVQAIAGNGRILAEAPIDFSGAASVSTKLSLPIELRNEIQSIVINGENHAGAKQLLDDRWRRKTIAIQSGTALEQAQPLLSPLHYVTRALQPYAELLEPTDTAELKSELESGLSMLVLADIGKLPQDAQDVIAPWVEKGGILLRFAGPRMAASTDDLVPVTLRQGDRNLGSALSWETPQAIQAFAEKSPFAGLQIDSRVTVNRQVLADPDAMLSEKTWVSLSDGTPLVTAIKKGKGQIILFHITANADWSTLPLSGTFVEMLQRIVDLAPAAGSTTTTARKDESSTAFSPSLLLAGSGELKTPSITINAIPAAVFDNAKASEKTPAGLYARGGQERAINLDLKEADVTSMTGIDLQKIAPPQTTSFAPQLFIAAALLFLADTLAALLLGGGLRRRTVVALVTALCITALPHPPQARAQTTDMQAALETHLAYVKTGDAEIDQTSQQGLRGLGLVMEDRTSAILGDPVAINIESDDIVFYPLLYWPVTESAQAPGNAALARLDTFMKNGGTIFFDLRDSAGDFSSNSGTTEALKRILAKLDIPPLEPVPESHALTRSFYLLKTFPGRYESGALWVESQNVDSPTSNSDGVSGIIIGSNDYAAAWALNEKGEPQNAMIPGSDRQREMAFRVGVNIVMYALTGNYKTDQVHVPALLERLGE